jgi:hypothetical protein
LQLSLCLANIAATSSSAGASAEDEEEEKEDRVELCDDAAASHAEFERQLAA